MILAVAGLVLPALFSTLVPDAGRIEAMSLMVAVILLVSYFAYLAYVLRGDGPFGSAVKAGPGDRSALQSWGIGFRPSRRCAPV